MEAVPRHGSMIESVALQQAEGDASLTGQIVCTLSEGRYFYGVAGLANSLVRSGFTGSLVVGYRGELPRWLGTPTVEQTLQVYAITPALQLVAVPVAGDWHLNNCKPHFIERVLGELCPQAEVVYYLDTDIVVTHPWSNFVTWSRSGVVLVLDVADSHMSPHHVYRHAWRALAARQGYECRTVTGYVNGGCIGINRAHAGFVTVWRRLMEELEREGADMRKMKNATGRLEFYRMDQDVLNATIMATDIPVALFGPEAMGSFPWVGEILPHAMWHRKPWDRNYIVDALRGFPPGRAHRAYWQHADGPVKPFTTLELSRKRLQLSLGHAIGLLHTRSFRDI
jgi:hypothetical protein